MKENRLIYITPAEYRKRLGSAPRTGAEVKQAFSKRDPDPGPTKLPPMGAGGESTTTDPKGIIKDEPLGPVGTLLAGGTSYTEQQAGKKVGLVPFQVPQQAAGIQTNSNAYGGQVVGPGVPGVAASGMAGTMTGAEEGLTTGGIQLGSGGIAGIYQPGFDVLGKQEGLLAGKEQLAIDQLEKDFADQTRIREQQEQQAIAGLQYDPETGTFTGLAGTEEERIRSPYEESIEAQRLQAQSQLQDVEFAKSQALEALATEKRRTEKTLAQQKLARETFAGLAGAFGSSRTFEFMQEKETEGMEILNEIDTNIANYTQYYGDKVQGVKDLYNLNVQSLRNNMTRELNDRYLGLITEVDNIRGDKASSIQQQNLDMRSLILEYDSLNNDLFATSAELMTAYNEKLYDQQQQIAAEDEVLRDTIGGAILDTYDTLVPGFVPSSGKIDEFTRTIYEGIKLWEESGGEQGFPNLQAGLGELMTAIKSNEAVFNRYNPAMQPTGGGGGVGAEFKLSTRDVQSLLAAGYTSEEIPDSSRDLSSEQAGHLNIHEGSDISHPELP